MVRIAAVCYLSLLVVPDETDTSNLSLGITVNQSIVGNARLCLLGGLVMSLLQG